MNPTRSNSELPAAHSRGPAARTLVALAVLALALAHIRYLWFVCDDAFITFRYAANLAAGLGPVWNPGERVEGYTNFLWMLVSALAARLGASPASWAPVAGTACALATLVAILWTLRHRGSAGTYAALLLATSSGFAAWATGGLETAAFTMFVTLGFLATAAALDRLNAREPRRTELLAGAASLALAALTRPDGLIPGTVIAAFVVGHAMRGRLSRAHTGAWFAVWAIPIVAHLAWRVSYYGRLLPHTAAVKSPGMASFGAGAAYVADAFAVQHLWLWLVPIAAAAVLGTWDSRKTHGSTQHGGLRAHEAMLAGVIVTPFLFYICTTGGDFMPLHRFVIPMLPILAIAAGAALEGIARRTPGTRGLAGALGASALVVTFAALDLRVSRREQEPWTRAARGNLESIGLTRVNAERWHRAGRRLAEIVGPGDTLATTAAGIIPYHTRLYTIDLLGLTARDLSHYRARDIQRAGHGRYLRGDWLAAHPPQILLGHPEVRERIEDLGLTLDLEPEWRDVVLAKYGLMGLRLEGNPPLYIACAVRHDVFERIEAAAKQPGAAR